MKHTSKLVAALFAIGLLCAESAQAGPGPQQIYTPIKSSQEADALPAKTKITVTCPSCGAITASTVDKEKSHMKSFACGMCKHTYEIVATGSGKASAGRLVCKDPKSGKTMPLQMCAMHH